MTGDGEYAGTVQRANGAWLSHVPDPSNESTPDAEFDAAASKATAKRIAVETARAWGYAGHHWWEGDTPGATLLSLYFARFEEEGWADGA